MLKEGPKLLFFVHSHNHSHQSFNIWPKQMCRRLSWYSRPPRRRGQQAGGRPGREDHDHHQDLHHRHSSRRRVQSSFYFFFLKNKRNPLIWVERLHNDYYKFTPNSIWLPSEGISTTMQSFFCTFLPIYNWIFSLWVELKLSLSLAC